ncbi:MAG: hypothetical protein OHK006_12000 [Thermodesulfovibrionales bacterium]
MERRADHVARHVEPGQTLPVNPEKTVVFCHERDLALVRLSLDRDAFTCQGPGEALRCLVLVQFVRSDLENEEVLLAQPLEMANVLAPHDMALAERPAFELSRPHLGDVVSEHGADSLCHRDRLAVESAAAVKGVIHALLLKRPF